VTARRKMASVRIGTHRRLLRVAMDARLVSAIIEDQRRHASDAVTPNTKKQEDASGGAH
jgi:hypothetical protein